MEQNTGAEKLTNYFLLVLTAIIFFGIVMVFSSSYIYSKEQFGSSFHFLTKQIIFIMLGGISAYIISRTKLSFWYKHAYAVHGFFVGILMLTLVPGLSMSMKGSKRWLHMGALNLQPGEFVKYSIILVVIKYFENFNQYTPKQRSLYLSSIVIPLMIFVVQPDFGTFFISAMIVAFVAFLSHFPRKYFYSGILIGMIGMMGILVAAPYRVKRLLVYLDPWKDPKNAGFQIIQSFLAFANGSVFGSGLGNSNEKLFYLPEAYNDFIFSVVGEELGLVGVCMVVLLFLSLIFLGLKLSLTTKSRLASMVVATITFTIGFQAFLNMGVVLGLLPTKGLNLPFISYGGSSMMANIGSIGLLLAALKMNSKEVREAESLRLEKNTPLKSIFNS